MHIAEVGPREAAEVLLRPPKPGRVPGLTYAETTANAPLGEPLLPPRRLGPVGMIAAWESDAALDEFCARHPVAAHLAGGLAGAAAAAARLRRLGRDAGAAGAGAAGR